MICSAYTAWPIKNWRGSFFFAVYPLAHALESPACGNGQKTAGLRGRVGGVGQA
ncbi:MAG: hypothetical protein ACJAYH_002146 [Celeribacter sp.]|jgi:hypothetical protein